jgi:2-phosphoglycolate phosphatase
MTTNQTKAVAFDLDGTLADTLPAMEATYNGVVAPRIGRAISREEIVSRLGPRAIEIMRVYDPEDPEGLHDAVVEHYLANHRDHARLYPGVADLVAALADDGYALGVATSMGRATAIPLLEHLGLLDRFRVIVTEDDVAALKPDPEPILRAAEGLGVAPQELLMIGDNPTDMQAARAAGAIGGAAVWGFYGRKAAADADWVFAHPADALAALGGRAA